MAKDKASVVLRDNVKHDRTQRQSAIILDGVIVLVIRV